MTTARDAALKAAEWATKADAAAATASDHRKKAAHFARLQSNRHHAAEHRADAERADARQQRAIASATMWAAVAGALTATEGAR
ncbi:hypothetical protein [Streptomyces sp. MBT60]|uniref:hypothetical protein n=1 Tax=Streptomyces sp. MBT60 TaxID=2800409 RepID=UPI001909A744|nr:hypothetical protein [Streptomyces sp. MBT60]MBK3548132.1 hypothetical protein [Streptomyces sp. MBT60]